MRVSVFSSLHSLLPKLRLCTMSPGPKLVHQVHRQKMKKSPAERAWSALQAAYTSEAAPEEAVPKKRLASKTKTGSSVDVEGAAPASVIRKLRLAAATVGAVSATPSAAGLQKRSRREAGLPERQPAAVRAKTTLAPRSDDEEVEEPVEKKVMVAKAAAGPAAGPAVGAHQSTVRFDSLDISPLTKRVMAEVFQYEYCTHVQAQTIGPLLTGMDVVAKAKTGTGKTLAFMIPAIQALVTKPQSKGQVGVLVLSPTRELAMQIVTETEKLLQFQNMSVQAAIGGTNLSSTVRKLQVRVPDVLVATPGRCLDLLENSCLGPMVSSLRILVLDEADNILDMGFRPTLDKILARLPQKERRQTMLFSATFPSDVKALAAYAFRPSYKIIDTVGAEDNTNVQVEQYKCVVPHAEVMLQLSVVLKEHMKQEPEFKVVVFFPTARMTQLYAEAFQHMGVGEVLEIHSRKSQGARTRVSDAFRAASCVSMFTSDVSARGVDYPGVTLVIQVGLPSDKAQYVHRVGRTARAGRAGQSVLLLAVHEQKFLQQLAGLPVLDMPPSPSCMDEKPLMTRALAKVPLLTKEQAYQAWLGFYNTAPSLRHLRPEGKVELANEFSRIIGCLEPPELEAKTVGKMGLKGVAGLRIAGKGGPYGGHAHPPAKARPEEFKPARRSSFH